MKKVLPLMILLSFAITSFAQSPISIDPEFIEFNRDGLDLTDNYLDELEKFTVCNVSDATIDLIWVLERSPGCEANWQTQVCDNNVCFDFDTETNDGIINTTMTAGECSDLFSLHVWPRQTAGCCNMAIHYYLADDLDNSIGSIEFDIRINDPDCLLSDTKEEIASTIQVYPNPVTSHFYLDGNQDKVVKKLALYNLLGRQVRTYDAVNQSQFDMSGLPQGIYLMGMIGANGELLRTIRLNRQFETP